MGNKGPKTLRGMERKIITGDGRKSTPHGESYERGK